MNATLHTNFGDITIQFLDSATPNTVANFVKLAGEGFYNGTKFHRVIKSFMIQGGDPLTKDDSMAARWGTGGPGYQIKAEFNDTPHKRGIVSMARSQSPDSAGSQFFIVVKDSGFLDRQYTAFGRVIRGIEVADQIVGSPRDARDNPNERVEMTVRFPE